MVSLFLSASLVLFGRWHARGRWHCRESLVGRRSTRWGAVGTFDRVSEHHIRRGQRAARSSRSQGSAESFCARIKGANWGISEGKVDL